jgi:hypothetical protein
MRWKMTQNTRLVIVIASTVLLPSIAQAEPSADTCKGRLSNVGGSLELRNERAEGMCIIAKGEQSKVLALCSEGSICEVSGCVDYCKGSGECVEASNISSVRVVEGREQQGEPLGSLQEIASIYGHSQADCDLELSGRLDQLDNATYSQYEMIGICEDGIDAFHQPVECAASRIKMSGDEISFLSTCYVKDYPAENGPSTVSKTGKDAITISLDTGNFSVAARI